MSDAQREVLKMLADKVISVDEAERLLKALNEGQKRKQESKSHGGGGFTGFGGAFESLGETLADIGPMIKNTIEDVMTGLFGEMSGDLDDEEFEHVEPVEGKFRIAEGMHMVLVNDWRGGSGKSDLVLQGIEGDFCRIEEEGAKPLQVQQSSSHFIIRWQGGPLKVAVPKTVTKIKVRMKNGDITVERIGCEITLRTLAGNLDMNDLSTDFQAKTMGGNITLALAQEWQGNAQAHTMGGNITLSIPENVSLKAEATSTGGNITVDERIRQIHRKQSFPGRNSVGIQAGDEQTDSFIALKTMGGGIELRKGHHE